MERRPWEQQKAERFIVIPEGQNRSKSIGAIRYANATRHSLATTNGSVAPQAGLGYESNRTTLLVRAFWGVACSTRNCARDS